MNVCSQDEDIACLFPTIAAHTIPYGASSALRAPNGSGTGMNTPATGAGAGMAGPPNAFVISC